MKRVLAFLLAMVLVLSFSLTAFAADPTGSITITNATVGQTYKIYKIFDATVKLNADGKAEAISYTIADDSQFHDVLFGSTGEESNTYFIHDHATGAVTKRAAVVDTDVINYLAGIVRDEDANYDTAADDIVAATSTVKFENLPYGYYMILSSLGTVVTINSTTPHATVIDKNQKPGDFELELKLDDGSWGKLNSAAIGDEVIYKITMPVTNYDGANQIRSYQIHNAKGDGLWVDFHSVTVKVGDQVLTKGYYLNHGSASLNSENMSHLGGWTGEPSEAEWYLVQLSLDEFRITIPWLDQHTLENVTGSDGQVVSHVLGFASDSASKFASPLQLEITYKAAVEANALIGGGNNSNLINTASATWTSANETGSSATDKVETKTYGLGVLKDDGATGANLAGAHFEIYSDSACTAPLNVIPTDVEGVYMVDSKGRAIEQYEAVYHDVLTARKEYNYDGALSNQTITPVNGKIVVLGLKEGTYYLKEVKAPDGYNSLSAPVEFKAGEGTKAFNIFADSNGKVADIQVDDGVHGEIIYQLTSSVIHNSKGVELPSTGGKGTILLITLGALLATAFAVLLITNKKMSVYED